MRTTAVFVVLSVITPTLPGCMRISRGPLQLIDVQTDPPGATLTVRPGPATESTSPTTLELNRKAAATVNVSGGKSAAYVVTASKPGYQSTSLPIESTISDDTWIDNLIWIHPVLIGLGWVVDITSGAGYELRPSNLLLVLRPEQS